MWPPSSTQPVSEEEHVTVVPESEFLRLKPIAVTNLRLTAKIAKLLDQYACFASAHPHSSVRGGVADSPANAHHQYQSRGGEGIPGIRPSASNRGHHHSRVAPHCHHHSRGGPQGSVGGGGASWRGQQQQNSYGYYNNIGYASYVYHGYPNKLAHPGGRHHHHGRRATSALVNSSQMLGFERALQGLLNKITHRNYDKLAAQIVGMFGVAAATNDARRRFVDIILEKCYKQVTLSEIFLRLICDIRKPADQESQEVIDSTLDAFVSEFLQSGLANSSATNVSSATFAIHSQADYDDFCRQVSSRRQLLGKHITILSLIKHMLYDRGAQYLHAILALFDEEDDLGGSDTGSSGAKASTTASARHELLLDILLEFVKFDRAVATRIRDHVRRSKISESASAATSTTSFRTRFKIRDILDAHV